MNTKRTCNYYIKANGIDAAFKKFAGVERLLVNGGTATFKNYDEAMTILEGLPKHAIENPAAMPQAERDAAIVALMNQPTIVMEPVTA